MSYPNEASTQTIKDQHSSKEFSQPETPNDMNNDQASRGSFNTQTTDNLQVIEHRGIQWDNRQYNTSRSGFREGGDLRTTNKPGQLLLNGLSTVIQIMLGVVPPPHTSHTSQQKPENMKNSG